MQKKEQKIIIGNFKMNILTVIERERYCNFFKKEMREKKFNNLEIVLCPPSIHLENLIKNIKNKKVFFGAQNIFSEREGAYTGEISALMVKEVGAEYVIVGHSERRNFFLETNEISNIKIQMALKYRLRPVYCFGESRLERDNNLTKKKITEQIQQGLKGISPLSVERVFFAYEPIWSVGTDIVPSVNEIMEVKILVRKILTDLYSSKTAQTAKILYGGSVSFKTAKKVCVEPEMDGVLVGRESLNPREFLKIAEIINNVDNS